MKIAFYVAHPAHYHYFKFSAQQLRNNGHEVIFLAKNKDILLSLLENAGEKYEIIAHKKSQNYVQHILYAIQADLSVVRYLRKERVDMIIGSQLTGLIRKLTNTAIINTGEDDAKVLGIYPPLAYTHTHNILSPTCCDNGRWNRKTITFPSYMKIGYLHPNNFKADRHILDKYGINTAKPYYIIRFSSLNAHHDKGIIGINTEIAQRLIDILSPHGTIYITSERPLETQFEPYRIEINPLDMHHVMAFASLYIGDSQTMAAEAGILGVPFIRYNGFVGRIGYLDELEIKYELGFGIQSNMESKAHFPYQVRYRGKENLYEIVRQLVLRNPDELRAEWLIKRNRLLTDKIDYAKFLTYFIENYPQSVAETKKANEENDKEFWERFKTTACRVEGLKKANETKRE